MKVLLSTTIIVGFILSSSIQPGSEAAAIQPFAPLSEQIQLRQIAFKSGDEGKRSSYPVKARHYHRGKVAHKTGSTSTRHSIHRHSAKEEAGTAAITRHGIHHHQRAKGEHRAGTATTRHGMHLHHRGPVEHKTGTAITRHSIHHHQRAKGEHRGTHIQKHHIHHHHKSSIGSKGFRAHRTHR